MREGEETPCYGDDGEPVTCAHGLRVIPDASWGNGERFDLFLLPGVNMGPLQADEEFLQPMRDLAAGGTLMASVCTGALVYAKAGLLDGRPATRHWSALDRPRRSGRSIPRPRTDRGG